MISANVDQGSKEVLDMIYLPLSMLFNVTLQQQMQQKQRKQGQPLPKERVVIAGLDCLLSLLRMLRAASTSSSPASSSSSSAAAPPHKLKSEEITAMTTSILAWLSSFLEHHRTFSEEINLHVVATVQFTFERFLPSAEKLVPKQIKPHIGCHIAYTLEQVIEASSKGSQGSKALVKSLLSSASCIVRYLSRDQRIIAFFLPGIVSKLSVVLLQAAGKSKEHFASRIHNESLRQCVTGPMANSACIEQAIECFALILESCFQSYEPREDNAGASRGEVYLDKLNRIVKGEETESASSSMMAEDCNEEMERIADKQLARKGKEEFVVDCDHSWYTSSFEKVEQMMKHFLPDLCGHPSHSVRKCIANSISKVSQKCRQFQKSRCFLECLLALSHDDVSDINAKASELVYSYGERYAGCKRLQQKLLEEVDVIFADYLRELVPAAKHTSSLTLLAKKLSSLLCLGRCMYIKHLYKEKINYLTRFLDALRNCFSFDVMKTMERSGGPLIWYKNPNHAVTRNGEGGEASAAELGKAAVVLPRMHSNFAFLHTLEDYEAATLICRTLGIIALETQCSESIPVFDYIVRYHLALFEGSDKDNHGWYLKAMSSCSMMSEMLAGCDTLGEVDAKQRESLSSAVSLMIEEESSAELWETVLDGPHSRCTQLSCIILESFAVFSRILGDVFTERYEFLPTALYVLLDKFGDDRNPNLQASAETSLRCICSHCHYTSIPDLLFKNSDYVIDTLVNHLMHLELYPHTTRIFKAVVTVMQRSDENCLAFLGLIREPCHIMSQNMSVYARHMHTGHIENYIDILHSLAGMCLSGAEAYSLLPDEKKEDHRETSAFVLETSSSMALQCSELLHTASAGLGTMLLLDIINLNIKALVGSSKLLPTIASTWPQIMLVLKFNRKHVVGKCVRLLAVMVKLGGKFMQNRVLNSFWPALDRLLRQQENAQLQCAALDALCMLDSECVPPRVSLRAAKTLSLLLKTNSKAIQVPLHKAVSSLMKIDYDPMFTYLFQYSDECTYTKLKITNN